MAAEWLSEEWLNEVAARAASRPSLPGASGSVSVGIPAGRGREIGYHWHYRNGVPGDGAVGTLTDADLALVIERADARSVLIGELEPSVAYIRGRLKATGDGGLLLELLKSTATELYREWRQTVRDLTEPIAPDS